MNIKKPEFYEEKLNEATSIRYELNEMHHKEMNSFGTLFREAFGLPTRLFMTGKNMAYYKGGYPKETSPPKLQSLLSEVAQVVKLFQYLGMMDELRPYLNEFGLEISVTPEAMQSFTISADTPIETLKKKKMEKVQALYNELFKPDEETEVFNMSKKALAQKLMSAALLKQKTICALADSVKLDIAEEVEVECDVAKPNFMRAVGLSVKRIKKGDIEEDLAKIDESIDNLEAAISVLKG